jgi:hypothetical protein
LNFPFSWIALSLGAPAYSVMIISICISFLNFIARIFILRSLINYSIIYFFKEVVCRIFIVSAITVLLAFCIYNMLSQSFFRLCILTIVSVIAVCGCVYTIGLNKTEREMVRNMVRSKINNKKISKNGN